jgi:prepilin-type N-terminal cleavage/methylation domain-containing protein
MTLIELMAAIVVFGIAATGLTAGFIAASQKTRLDKNRVAASNLAARELEIVRNQFNASSAGPTTIAGTPSVSNPDPLPGGTAGDDLQVDGVPYTVVRRVNWLPAGTGQSPCDGGSAVTYPTLAVNVAVSWPAMGQVKPVESNTVLTPPKGVLASTTSFVAVKVLGPTNIGQENVPVTLTGPGGTISGTTQEDGCATMAVTTAGAYTASLNTAGWVDYYGVAAPTKPVTVTAGSLTSVQFNYAKSGSMALTLATTSGYALPTGLRTVTIANTGLQPSGTLAVDIGTGGSATIATLWPFSDGYTVWAGSCAQSDPATAGGSRATAVVVPSNGTIAATRNLAPVQVNVTTATLVPVANATVTATPVSTTGCAATENPLTLGVTNAAGQLLTSMPAGVWTLKVTGRSASPSWPNTANLLPTSSPTTVAVKVV